MARSLPAPTPRLREPVWRLLIRATGGPRALGGKLARIGRTARLWARPRELDRRLARLRAAGLTDAEPSRRQLLFGGIDMLRFLIEPGARDYYAQRGISFGLHQLLRVLDDPVSMLDPTGLMSDRDTIAGHLMQVVHLNPSYDVQLLEAFDGGLAELVRQLEEMIAGRHPRSGTIGAIVEEAGYHARLLEYVRAYRSDRAAPPPIREPQPLRANPHFAAAERTLSTLPGFLAYCERLPDSTLALVRRLRSVRSFPLGDGEKSGCG